MSARSDLGSSAAAAAPPDMERAEDATEDVLDDIVDKREDRVR